MTFSTRSTSYHSFIGMLALPVASPHRWLQLCAAPFMLSLLQEAADHIPHVSEQFHTYTDGDNLAILLNKDTFVPNADKHPIVEESASKNTWGLTALIVRGHLRRPPAGSPKMVHFLPSPLTQRRRQET